MNVLIGCEFSGIIREAFKEGGHNAFSCDYETYAQGWLNFLAPSRVHLFRKDAIKVCVALVRQGRPFENTPKISALMHEHQLFIRRSQRGQREGVLNGWQRRNRDKLERRIVGV